jgi:hypothetical protein
VALSVTIVTARYPGLADEPGLEQALADAALQVLPEVWGTLYRPGLAALAAHLLAVRAGLAGGALAGRVAGPVTSRRARNLAESYGAAGGAAGGGWGYADTEGGREYLRLRGMLAEGTPGVY